MTSSKRFPIVGIGASAGGIEALDFFFRAMPPDIGLAFVVVTHLSPERESMLHEIVARYTTMPVEPARDGEMIVPNRVYVLPENAIIGIAGGSIQLRRSPVDRRERKPIDIFFSALAKDQGEYAVGIVLSGGDGDGTLGIRAIKEHGGLTLAQTADGGGPRHPDMPDHAIATGMVDFSVPADQMAAELSRFVRSLDDPDGTAGAGTETDTAPLEAIYTLLRSQAGHDFSGYKTRTFGRRVQRRMQVNQLETVESYVERLRQDPSEVAALFRDLLINVTTFFRDADAFEALRALAIPKLFEGRGANDVVRIWVPGCATGEEVYSLAILVREHLDAVRDQPRVQFFATDIDERSLAIARAGRYPESLLEAVSPQRRARFFTPEGSSSVLNKEIRELCIFSPHSVIRDPPFSRMDLVSCRNLLIYFGPQVQSEVLPTFYYALRPGGFLFLGLSENTGQFGDLFTPVDKKHRIFRARKEGRSGIPVPLAVHGNRLATVPEPLRHRNLQGAVSMRQRVEAHVLERYAPPHVVVNAEGDIVYYSERTGKYLEAAAGAPSRQLLGMARKGLSLELRAALRASLESRSPIVRNNVAVEVEDQIQMVNLTVSPMPEADGESLFLVLFADSGQLLTREATLRGVDDRDVGVAILEREIRDVRERLQSISEEYETALEELKLSNEELVSVNEELQSTNEELEASKEELQSLNEELQTVNVELSHKVDALDQANSEMRNLFKSTQVATLFLDRDLTLRNFTPSAEELFNLVPSDRGRPLAGFSTRLDYPRLHDDIRATLATGEPFEQAVSSEDGRSHYLARFRLYDGPFRETKGVILTFVDVTSLTAARARQAELIAALNHRVTTMMGVVVGIARQTALNASGVEPFTTTLVERLHSMARTYELLSREDWTEVPVEPLVRQELLPFGAARVRLAGPQVLLNASQALSLGVIVHELATNAARHGALSTAGGWIEIEWGDRHDETERRMRLVWRERGGPAVEAPAIVPGFGIGLIQREAASGFGGQALLAWDPAGLCVTLDLAPA